MIITLDVDIIWLGTATAWLKTKVTLLLAPGGGVGSNKESDFRGMEVCLFSKDQMYDIRHKNPARSAQQLKFSQEYLSVFGRTVKNVMQKKYWHIILGP